MKYAAALVLILFLFGGMAVPSHFNGSLLRSVGKLITVVPSPAGPEFYQCSCFVVGIEKGGALIMSAAHCTDPKAIAYGVGFASRLEDVLTVSDATDAAELVYQDARSDIAVFRMISGSVAGLRSLKFADSELDLGLTTYGAGFSSSGQYSFSLTVGNMAGLWQQDHRTTFQKLSIIITQGGSGGPLLNERQEVVGMADRAFVTPLGSTHYSPRLAELKKAVRIAKIITE